MHFPCAHGRTSTSRTIPSKSRCYLPLVMQHLKSALLEAPGEVGGVAGRWALFIDIDGTLLEMAPTPDAVVVPANLIGMLDALSRKLGGALALSTGRSVAEADRILAPLKLITSGVHGTEVRASPSGETTMLVQPTSQGLLKEIMEVARASPDIVVETKGAGIAVHYRKVPELRPYLEAELGRIAALRDTIVLRPGRRVLEVLPKGYSKGAGLASLMRTAPFKGRLPIMIGDDYGDESALAIAEELGGVGLRVAGEYFPPERADFSGVVATRRWLARVAGVEAYSDDMPAFQPADA
jgi:trehalose 6-phosphate phosphatase